MIIENAKKVASGKSEQRAIWSLKTMNTLSHTDTSESAHHGVTFDVAGPYAERFAARMAFGDMVFVGVSALARSALSLASRGSETNAAPDGCCNALS